MTKIINLISGPCSGKTATAGRLLGALKEQHISVGLALEYATDVIYEGRSHLLAEQDYIFAKQRLRFKSFVDKVDYVITDTSLLLSLIYAPDYPVSFQEYVITRYHEFNNVVVFIERSEGATFSATGRNHDAEQSYQKDHDIRELLNALNIPYLVVSVADPEAITKIMQHIGVIQ